MQPASEGVILERIIFAYLTFVVLYWGWAAARLKEEMARTYYRRCCVVLSVCLIASLLGMIAGQWWTLPVPAKCGVAGFVYCGVVFAFTGFVYGSVLLFRPALRGTGVRWLGISTGFMVALNFAAWMIQTDPFEIPGG